MAIKNNIISKQEIEEAFEGTNYGPNPNHKEIIADTLLKLSVGFGTGRTSICVCNELGLLTAKQKPNSKGLEFMRENYGLVTRKISPLQISDVIKEETKDMKGWSMNAVYITLLERLKEKYLFVKKSEL